MGNDKGSEACATGNSSNTNFLHLFGLRVTTFVYELEKVRL